MNGFKLNKTKRTNRLAAMMVVLLSLVGMARVGVGAYRIQPGDFNFDGELDFADVDMLSLAIYAPASADLIYDLDGDGDVDVADGTYFVEVIKGTHLGDFNLDGQVDTTDLSIWAVGYGQELTYSDGDANFDGTTDSVDLDIWGANFGS